ncbi:pyruvate-ferredoxin/flavodoxin oxidoreductase [Novimethylophilus kurashikiensis]|uniref:Pyruvate-ferredoxin/flavodoxin oxidoreductase n=1 Tax=Novimethylophilus kurashikiensis TaxID=1825523 RepID=A0A2R5F8Y7_9PROT|nr:2-oxoacid:acceptor oxidoreductase family protein [Novimethylophilus kurashikiensis]GBG13141.1 pyruvate-ferredoxin/flavodoxin oxidoreductase [Novimethylophilus kurashikiensis]
MLKYLKEFHLLEPGSGSKSETRSFKYPGVRDAIDGNTAVILVEREASDAAGAYPITPSTQMGEYWSEAASNGYVNASGRPLIFVEPESEHAAAGVTAGMSMTGLRAVNFTSSQGAAFMHESLYAAVGKRLPYVLNVGCRAITKASLNVHCSHDDYHCLDDTGFIQVFGRSAQEACDLNLIARKTAELSLTPAINAMDGFLTTHLIEPVLVPEKELVAEYLGRPDDIIDTPTPSQRLLYGERRRRIPASFDVDNPMTTGGVQNQDAYMQAVAAQRPYFFDHIEDIFERNAQEYYDLTGRRYARVMSYGMKDADYVIVGQGSMCIQAQAVADYLRETRKIKVGVVSIIMFRPFPGDLLGALLKGRKGVAVLERTDQPLAEDLPLMRETRATMSKCLENGLYKDSEKPYPTYASCTADEMPRLYSGCFGLGSRDFQPESIIAAVENMMPGGQHRKFFYLGIEFVRDEPANPKQEIAQQNLLDAYPRIGELSIKGSENPNLLPKGAIAVRMHSIGGWGAVTTGKNLAITLFDLLGWDIKANPKYGSEKKGQPTTYYLSAAPEPIRINCEYKNVDVVLSPDPNVFSHTNALAGLKKGGTFIIQSNLATPEEVWASFPITAQKYIADNEIRVFYLDAFKIAREEASNPDLQLRMQGNVFQGAFFAASPVMQNANLTEEQLFAAIENQLESKFGKKGKRVVEDNLRVVRRGFVESHEITGQQVGATRRSLASKESGLPIMLKTMPEGDGGIGDVHRFWESTGNFYISGKGNDNLADPFIGLSVIPASTGVFRDMTQIRFEHPVWIAENCTACGNCYTECPDMAIPGLVNTVQQVFETAISNVERRRPTRFLRKASRTVEKKLRMLVEHDGEATDVRKQLDLAITATIAEAPEEEREKLAAEFGLFRETIGDFQFSITKPYYTNKEKKAKGSGGLFSITINPYACKSCELCVQVCEDDALKMVTQTEESTEKLRREWDFWTELPTTPQEYSRIDNLDEKIGALETLLLDKHNYGSMVGGDGACLGCGEKTAIHLFTSTVSALMQPRVEKHMEKVDELIARLEKHIRMKVTESVDFSDTDGLMRAMQTAQGDITLASLSANLTEGKASQPLDPDWLRRVSQLLDRLRHLKQSYTAGAQGHARSDMGVVNSTGCTSVWASTFPFNPYPFPWTSHLFQDAPSVAMGLFEGHMVKMADGFKAVRAAELELEGEYKPDEHDAFLTHFNWRQFSDEEWLLCPPIVAIGGDGAMYDIGFQNLSRMLMSGAPIKVLVVDTQVYSNTGGQACTSGFISQVADMSPFGKASQGKQEIRKEISLLGLAHRSSFVLQSAISNVTHLLEGYIDGLNSRRPALLNVYAVCPPEHGVADDLAVAQSKLAVESRAYPLFRYDPDKGAAYSESVSLEGNPAMEQDWPTYTLTYKDETGAEAKLTVPMTFADFAVTEGRFAKHFKKAPPETWNDDMVQLADFLKLEKDDREGKLPFIWGVDAKQRLIRLLVTQDVVNSCQERLDYWHQLKSIAGLDRAAVDEQAIADKARADLIQKLSASLATLGISADLPQPAATVDAAPAATQQPAANADGYEAAWIETPECTACDECMNINAKIFAYNDQKKAIVINPQGGKFADIVKAAEKCTAGCIHPGTPWNMSEPGVEKLVQRAAKFN